MGERVGHEGNVGNCVGEHVGNVGNVGEHMGSRVGEGAELYYFVCWVQSSQ